MMRDLEFLSWKKMREKSREKKMKRNSREKKDERETPEKKKDEREPPEMMRDLEFLFKMREKLQVKLSWYKVNSLV